jgi:hypothetical protein
MTDVSDAIERFRQLLSLCWPIVEEIARDNPNGFVKSDWLQSNWEIFVELQLCQKVGGPVFLVIYGDGAEANGASSRILDPSSLSTHHITCHPNNGDTSRDHLNGSDCKFPDGGLPLDRFVTLTDSGWYCEGVPFDMVLIDSEGGERIFAVEDIRFQLREI